MLGKDRYLLKYLAWEWSAINTGKEGMISSTCDIYKKKQKKINQNKLYTKNINLWYTLIYKKK
jgi:hypothetical protein